MKHICHQRTFDTSRKGKSSGISEAKSKRFWSWHMKIRKTPMSRTKQKDLQAHSKWARRSLHLQLNIYLTLLPYQQKAHKVGEPSVDSNSSLYLIGKALCNREVVCIEAKRTMISLQLVLSTQTVVRYSKMGSSSWWIYLQR